MAVDGAVELPPGKPFASEKVNIDGATSLTPATYRDDSGQERSARHAVITVDGQPIRWTVSGTTPTSTLGHGADADSLIILHGIEQIEGFEAIKEGGTASDIQVTYIR